VLLLYVVISHLPLDKYTPRGSSQLCLYQLVTGFDIEEVFTKSLFRLR